MEHLGSILLIFRDLGLFWKKVIFWCILEAAKLYKEKFRNMQNVIQMMSATWILAGLVECAGQPGGGGGLKPSILDLEGV